VRRASADPTCVLTDENEDSLVRAEAAKNAQELQKAIEDCNRKHPQ
jgi:hypothetical protein